MFVSLLAAATVLAQDVDRLFEFDIDRGGLDNVLEEFRELTDVEFIYPYELIDFDGLNSVYGRYTIEEALGIALRGTGLSGRLTDSGMIVIAIDQSTFVQSPESDTVNRNVKKGLFATLSAIIFGVSSPADTFGQSADAADEETEESIAASLSGGLDEIIVTGSRLDQTSLTAGSPVRVIGAEQIKLRGFTNVADSLVETPGVTVEQFNLDGTNSANSGFQSLSLRGLGSERTLTLINGRRQVSGQVGTTAVDLSTIPNSLVERIEVVTGGGSSVYGTDAVAGVVNVITRSDFEGIDFGATYRVTGENDGETLQGSIVAGMNFHEGRGNVTGSMEYSEDEPALNSNRQFISDLTTGFPTATGNQFFSGLTRVAQSANGVLLYNVPVLTTNIQNAAGRLVVDDGTLTGAAGNNVVVSSDGQFFESYNPGTPLGLGLAQNGDGTSSPATGSNFVGGESDRFIGSFNANYELRPGLSAFLETKYVARTTRRFGLAANAIVRLDTNNPFLPAGITPTLLAGQAPVVVPPFPGVPPLPPLPALPTEIYVGKTFDDVGPIILEDETEVHTAAFGLNGVVLDDLEWELFATYGRTELDERRLNDFDAANLLLALNAVTDASGNIVCADPDPTTMVNEATDAGCAPYNVLGQGTFSAEALRFVTPDLSTNTVQKQSTVGFFVGGSKFDAPAGPVDFSLGYSYREDKTDSNPSLDFINGAGLGPDSRRSLSGRISVNEAYLEVGVPILKNLPFVESLNATLSGSLADYSTVGTVGASKISTSWQVVDSVRFRGSYARAVRAPNINEAFPVESLAFQPFPQPCGAVGINLVAPDPAVRQANCEADLGVGNVPVVETVFGINIDRRANPNLAEETSTTFTFGTVLQPSFIDGLTITMDYYDVEIDDAITTVDPFAIFGGCYDQATFPGLTCGELVSDPTTNLVTTVFVQPINVDSLQTSGIDVGINYSSEISDILGSDRNLGTIGFNYAGLFDLEGIQFSVARPEGEELVGVGARPDYEHSLGVIYGYGPFSLFTNWRYRGDSDMIVGGASDFGSISYFDMTLNYSFRDRWDITFGVTNLTDKEPRLQDGASARIDDFMGRTFFTRLNGSF